MKSVPKLVALFHPRDTDLDRYCILPGSGDLNSYQLKDSWWTLLCVCNCVSRDSPDLPGSVVMINSYDHVPLLVSRLDVPVGLDHLLQRIASVDHRFELTRLSKVH